MKKPLALLLGAVAVGCAGNNSSMSGLVFKPGASVPVNRQVIFANVLTPVQYVANPAAPTIAYVIQRGGQVRVVVNDVLQDAPVLDVSSMMFMEGEGGLLSMVLDPDFATNHYFYLHYTIATPDEHSQIVRYTMSDDMMTASSPFVITDVPAVTVSHKGGAIHFGRDGYLYWALGDGSNGNDPLNNSQNPMSLYGKMMRIDPHVDDFPTDPLQNYGIPPSNPWATSTKVRHEIWSLGYRNPWRWSFDSVSGAIIVGDVGESHSEEVDYEPAGKSGRNYGWRVQEGNAPSGNAGPLFSKTLQTPMVAYSRGVGRSVTGGFVYHGSALPQFAGQYLFADFAGNRLWSLPINLKRNGEIQPTNINAANDLAVSDGWSGVVSIDPDINGEPIICEYNTGKVTRVVP